MADIGMTRKDHSKPIKVTSIKAAQIRNQISKLQDDRTAIYDNDYLTDEEVTEQTRTINEQITRLIESMY